MVRFEIALALVVTACSATPDPTPSGATAVAPMTTGLHDAAVQSKLHDVALQLSEAASNHTPATMKAVAAADHQAAETIVSGADINDHSPVYVVQVTGGKFTVPHARPGVAAHVGDVLTITFDAKTMRVTDVGYDDAPADLARIDPDVVELRL